MNILLNIDFIKIIKEDIGYPGSAAIIIGLLLFLYIILRNSHLFYEHLTCNAYSDESHFRKADVRLHKTKNIGFYQLDIKYVPLELHQIKTIRATKHPKHTAGIKYKKHEDAKFYLYKSDIPKELIKKIEEAA